MTNREKNGVVILIVIIIMVLGHCSNPTNNAHVKKGSSYDASYNEQVEDLKKDLNKSNYDGIVIYDDNCDTVLEISK